MNTKNNRLRRIGKDAEKLKAEMDALGLKDSAALMSKAVERLGREVGDQLEITKAREIQYLINTPDWIDADLFCGDGEIVAFLVADVKNALEMLQERGAGPAKCMGSMVELRDGTYVLPIRAQANHVGRPYTAPATGYRFGKIVSLLPGPAIDRDVLQAVQSRTCPKRLVPA